MGKNRARCPECHKALKGLFEDLSRDAKKNYRYIRRAYYCKGCKAVFKDEEVVFLRIMYFKNREYKLYKKEAGEK